MNILSIETSCDETAVCLARIDKDAQQVQVLGNALSSQIALHSQYGGVFPTLAKRAHAEKITALIEDAFSQAGVQKSNTLVACDESLLTFLDEKNADLKEYLVPFFCAYEKPDIDAIAVTVGPGLEPALWVGVVTARALAIVWNIPVIPINHMEGHFVTAQFMQKEEGVFTRTPLSYPVLGLLVSGGHSELVISEEEGMYKKIGATRDDAVGEAFDKVARMLGLPYPGGPAVSKLARGERESKKQNNFVFPRPMMHSGDYDFSFSGIKTAVLYAIRDVTDGNTRELTDEEKSAIACEFENAVIEVLVKKTQKAVQEYGAQTVIIGGGVAGNTHLKDVLTQTFSNTGTTLLFPEGWLSTDNAIMISLAAATQVFGGKTHLRSTSDGQAKTSASSDLKADGNLSF
jgi:N6-L-threonylcarbamoyladenine synthase